MNRASRMEKAFYMDSNLYRPDRKRRLNYKNDQNLCSSSFVVVGRSNFARTKLDPHQSSSASDVIQGNVAVNNGGSEVFVPSLDLDTSFTSDYSDTMDDLTQTKSANRSASQVLANEPYHRSWTSIDRPYHSSNFHPSLNVTTQNNYHPNDSARSGSVLSQNENTFRAGTPLGLGQTHGSIPSTPAKPKQAANPNKSASCEKTVTFSTKTPELLCTGRGDTLEPRFPHSGAARGLGCNRGSGWTLKEKGYECVPPYGTSTNSIKCNKLLHDQFVSSPTKTECYNKRNESQIFSR